MWSRRIGKRIFWYRIGNARHGMEGGTKAREGHHTSISLDRFPEGKRWLSKLKMLNTYMEIEGVENKWFGIL